MIPDRSLFRFFLSWVLVVMIMAGCSSGEPYTIDGELKTWHTLTFSFKGPRVSEQDFPNPFLKYRLMVEFVGEKATYLVPGYFAADGNASETGATEGDVWQVRFKPDHPGNWSIKVSFREGENLFIDLEFDSGTMRFAQ